MKFVEYVPDHILRDFAKIGQKRTVLAGAQVRVMIPSLGATYSYEEQTDIEITISNFLPGYTEVYTNRDGVKPIHNHQFVWIVNDRNGDPHEYRSTDINNMKEVREAPALDPPKRPAPVETVYEDPSLSRYQGEFIPKGPERQGEF